MRKISITACDDGRRDAAFSEDKMSSAGIDRADLLVALSRALQPFATLLRDGCGVAVILNGDTATITGLREQSN